MCHNFDTTLSICQLTGKDRALYGIKKKILCFDILFGFFFMLSICGHLNRAGYVHLSILIMKSENKDIFDDDIVAKDSVEVYGARVHNLKNIDVTCPTIH